MHTFCTRIRQSVVPSVNLHLSASKTFSLSNITSNFMDEMSISGHSFCQLDVTQMVFQFHLDSDYFYTSIF